MQCDSGERDAIVQQLRRGMFQYPSLEAPGILPWLSQYFSSSAALP